MEMKNLICALAVVVSVFIQAGECLYCYQCDSSLDSNCQEKWDESLQVNQDKYTLCQLWDAQYCAKVTGMWGGVVGTHRFCTSKNLGDQCQDIWFPDHNRMYRACVYSCSSDGCNGAGTYSLHPIVTLTVLLSSAIALARRL